MVDEMMPAMLGSEMTQRLRQYELANKLPHLPVICVTANTSAEDRIRCVSLCFHLPRLPLPG